MSSATDIAAYIDSNSDSFGPYAVSGDGRFAAVWTEASNLVPDDSNGASDIIVYDTLSGAATLGSAGTGGVPANAGSSQIAGLSDDGRYLAFASTATNLSPLATNGLSQIYLSDRVAGSTVLVSRSTGGQVGAQSSFDPKVSADGRYVTFHSGSDNLVAGDSNGAFDVFRHDVMSGETIRVSVANDGAQALNNSTRSGVSADGRYVVFQSVASNLVPGDSNNQTDVFLRDVQAGTTERISVGSGGTQLNQASFLWNERVISADGRYVVFTTLAAADPADTNAFEDIYRHDRNTDETLRISVSGAGVQGNQASTNPSMSADGQRVLFRSSANNLAPDDTNGNADAFVRDVAQGTTILASVRNGGGQTAGDTIASALSADGGTVFWSNSGDSSASSDSNGFYDVYRRVLPGTLVTRISAAHAGSVAPFANNHSTRFGHIYSPSVSDDGRFVAFESRASNLVPDDTNSANDVFVRDHLTASTERISRLATGVQATCESDSATITPDGRYVVFTSCTPLVAPASAFQYEVYRYDRQTATYALVSVNQSGGQANGLSYLPHISHDGDVVAFHSCATDLVAGDTNSRCDVFVRQISLGVTLLANRSLTGSAGNDGAEYPRISGNGRYVSFASRSTDLVPGDNNGAQDVFVFDRSTLAVENASLANGGGQLNNFSYNAGLSFDGSRLAFVTSASNTGTVVTTPTTQVYVRDRASGVTMLASRRADGVVLNAGSYNASISGDGERVGFMSSGSNYTPGGNFVLKAFVSDLLPPGLTLVSRAVGGGAPNAGTTSVAQLSANGDHMVFSSQASNLIANDGNNRFADVFLARNVLGDTIFAGDFEPQP